MRLLNDFNSLMCFVLGLLRNINLNPSAFFVELLVSNLKAVAYKFQYLCYIIILSKY